MLAALLAAVVAADVTETSDGQGSFPVTSGAYSNNASAAGLEADYTASTDGNTTTFTFLVNVSRTPATLWHLG